MYPATERLDLFIPRPSPHADDDGAGKDGLRQPAKPGQSNGGIARNFLSLDDLAAHHAAPGRSATPMSAIEQRAEFFVFLRLRTEDSIDLVEQNCWRPVFATDFAEQICGRDVHRR